ncbi:MAG: YibE/F family protein [Eubacterium sp.]|nr:YibE/F family protein [Eubacterium sp.]
MTIFKKSWIYFKYIIRGYLHSLQRKERMISRSALILLAVMAAFAVFTRFDSFCYKDTVAQITEAENVPAGTMTGPNGEQEQYYEQTLSARVLNGEKKGAVVRIKNTYGQSRIKSDRFRKGQQVFVTLTSAGREASIDGLKRDTAIFTVVMIFVFLVVLIAGAKGVAAIITLAVNVFLLYGALQLYENGAKLVWLAVVLVFLFTALSLIISNGISKYILVTLAASFTVMAAVVLIYQIVLSLMGSYEYLTMSYVVNPFSIRAVFFVEIVIGCLGAVVDASVTIAATVNELVKKNPEIARADVWKSVWEVGYDIMGTMVNILFFAYLYGSVPVILLKLTNGYSLSVIYKYQIPFELIRFLMGGIAILSTIPITGFFCVHLMTKRGCSR